MAKSNDTDGNKSTGRQSPGAGNASKGTSRKSKSSTIKRKGTTSRRRSAKRKPFNALIMLILVTIIVFLVKDLYFNKNKVNVHKSLKSIDEKLDRSEDKLKNKDNREIKEKIKKDGNKTDTPGVKKDETKKTENVIPEMKVKIYFLRFNESTEKVRLAYVYRNVSSDLPVRGVLDHLIKGPTKREEKTGILTAIPSRMTVRSVIIKNHIAVIDFNSAIEKNATGSILLNRIDQIVYTVTQFDSIRGVTIKINGRNRNVIGSDGLALSNPLTRRK